MSVGENDSTWNQKSYLWELVRVYVFSHCGSEAEDPLLRFWDFWARQWRLPGSEMRSRGVEIWKGTQLVVCI